MGYLVHGVAAVAVSAYGCAHLPPLAANAQSRRPALPNAGTILSPCARAQGCRAAQPGGQQGAVGADCTRVRRRGFATRASACCADAAAALTCGAALGEGAVLDDDPCASLHKEAATATSACGCGRAAGRILSLPCAPGHGCHRLGSALRAGGWRAEAIATHRGFFRWRPLGARSSHMLAGLILTVIPQRAVELPGGLEERRKTQKTQRAMILVLDASV